MEIPAWWFFSFWALISSAFSLLVLKTFDKTERSNSVSPVVMSFFKYSLIIFSICSTRYGVLSRPQWRYGVHRSYLWIALAFYFALIQCTINRTKIFSWSFLLYALIKITWLLHFLPKMKIFTIRYLKIFTIAIQMAVEASLFLISWEESTQVFPVHFIFISFYIFALSVVIEISTNVSGYPLSGDESSRELLPVAAKAKESFSTLKEKIGKLVEFAVGKVDTILSQYFFRLSSAFHFSEVMWAANMIQHIVSQYFTSVWNCLLGEPGHRIRSTIAAKVKEKKIRKWIEFAVGIVGSVLFQYFFRLTSFHDVMVFLYLANTWVANLVLLGVSHDYGVLKFVLGNVVMGTMASQFKLQMKTWLVLGASLLLFGLHLMLQSPTLIHREAEHTKVKLW